MQTNPLLWLSGVDLDTLSHCERERSKFVAMGGTVITTSVFAAVAATFTVGQFMHAPFVLALLVGLAWGLAIMNLDRWLLISIRRQKTATRTVVMAIPRVVLAVLIGILIAEPLVLRVFEDEVNAQATRNKNQERADAREEIRQQYASIPRLKAREDAVEGELTSVNGGTALSESPAYEGAYAALQGLEKRAARARHAALCELDGRCGTTKKGYGPAYEAKNAIAEELGEQVTESRSSLNALGSRLLAQEGRQAQNARGFQHGELDQIRSQLKKLRAERQGRAEEQREKFTPEIGLLDRIEALGDLTSEHPSMLWIRIVLFLCILAIDTLPAIAKVLMSLGEPSLYERTQEELERSDIEALKVQAKAFAKATELDAEVLVDEAMTRRAAVKEVQDDLLDQAVGTMRQAGERFVSAWHDAVVERIDDLVDAELKRTGLRPRAEGPPPGESESNGVGQREP